MSTQDYPGQRHIDSGYTDYLVMRTVVEQMLSRVSSATLAQVKSVTTNGEVAAVGNVSVLPLVKMQDSYGNVHSHGTVNNLPYFRLQGGAGKAVIMDPKVGDIGVVVFADRDISSVKKNKKESQPGSFRRFDMADGMFFPCFLGGAPTCYVRFTDDNKIIVSPDNGVTIGEFEADKISLQTSGRSVYIRPSRVDLGVIDAPDAVITTAGPSSVVFAQT